MLDKYQVIIRWSDLDNAYIAEIPELPIVAADGTSREEALSKVYEVGEIWMQMAQEKGWTIPKPLTWAEDLPVYPAQQARATTSEAAA